MINEINQENFKEELINSKKSDLSRELQELYQEGLIKEYKIISCEDNQINFTITTIENNTLKISTDVNYCYKVENSENLHENFEQLLHKHSEAYSSRFAKLIFDKLSELVDR